jgi:hypothetical protein
MKITTLAPLALAAAVALAGCETVEQNTGRNLGATLSGASEVPPNSSAGKGDAVVNYDGSTRVMKYTVNFAGLSGPATAAHFHGPAGAGANAGVVIPISRQGQPLTSPASGEVTLDEARAQQLLGGQWYINVHTAANPGGEIRGQVLPK